MTTLGWSDFAKSHDRRIERSLNRSLVSVTQNVVGPIEPEVPFPERTQKEVLGKAWNGSFHWCHGHFYNRKGDVPEIMLCILVSVTTSQGEESAGKLWGEVQLREGEHSSRIWGVPGGSWRWKSFIRQPGPPGDTGGSHVVCSLHPEELSILWKNVLIVSVWCHLFTRKMIFCLWVLLLGEKY